MCLNCGRNLCTSNFSGADGKEIYVCAECLEGIVEGESYVEIDFSCYHKECLELMQIEDLLDIFGYEVKTAGNVF
ncbi:MAG: hypothetical protein LBR74_02730 [Eubacterium sp.]|jgi:uncharacterized protein YacL (UPF0231 family)|nr:hypothetical protein [Eubacterium sp.]